MLWIISVSANLQPGPEEVSNSGDPDPRPNKSTGTHSSARSRTARKLIWSCRRRTDYRRHMTRFVLSTIHPERSTFLPTLTASSFIVETRSLPHIDSCAPTHFDLSVCPSMSLPSPGAPFDRCYPCSQMPVRLGPFYVAHPTRSIFASYFPCRLRFRRKLITVAIRANKRTSTVGSCPKTISGTGGRR